MKVIELTVVSSISAHLSRTDLIKFDKKGISDLAPFEALHRPLFERVKRKRIQIESSTT